MKIYKLDKEEKKIWKEMYRGEYKSIENVDEFIKELKESLKKEKKQVKQRINLRVDPNDLMLLKIKAKKTGLPYQTFINSELHKIAIK